MTSNSGGGVLRAAAVENPGTHNENNDSNPDTTRSTMSEMLSLRALTSSSINRKVVTSKIVGSPPGGTRSLQNPRCLTPTSKQRAVGMADAGVPTPQTHDQPCTPVIFVNFGLDRLEWTVPFGRDLWTIGRCGQFLSGLPSRSSTRPSPSASADGSATSGAGVTSPSSETSSTERP